MTAANHHGQAPIRVDLGAYECKRGDYRLELVIRRHLLSALIKRAMENKYGRTILAAGGLVLLARKVAPKPPAAEGGVP